MEEPPTTAPKASATRSSTATTAATSGSSIPENTELVVKALDGGGFNGHLWVFYGALTDLEYWITVTDTLTGEPPGLLQSVGQDLRPGGHRGLPHPAPREGTDAPPDHAAPAVTIRQSREDETRKTMPQNHQGLHPHRRRRHHRPRRRPAGGEGLPAGRRLRHRRRAHLGPRRRPGGRASTSASRRP